VVVHNEDTASLRKILGRHSAAAGGSSPVDWPQLQVGLAEPSRAAERAKSDRDFVQFDELAAEACSVSWRRLVERLWRDAFCCR
jgi:hypothetical protein